MNHINTRSAEERLGLIPKFDFFQGLEAPRFSHAEDRARYGEPHEISLKDVTHLWLVMGQNGLYLRVCVEDWNRIHDEDYGEVDPNKYHTKHVNEFELDRVLRFMEYCEHGFRQTLSEVYQGELTIGFSRADTMWAQVGVWFVPLDHRDGDDEYFFEKACLEAGLTPPYGRFVQQEMLDEEAA